MTPGFKTKKVAGYFTSRKEKRDAPCFVNGSILSSGREATI